MAEDLTEEQLLAEIERACKELDSVVGTKEHQETKNEDDDEVARTLAALNGLVTKNESGAAQGNILGGGGDGEDVLVPEAEDEEVAKFLTALNGLTTITETVETEACKDFEKLTQSDTPKVKDEEVIKIKREQSMVSLQNFLASFKPSPPAATENAPGDGNIEDEGVHSSLVADIDDLLAQYESCASMDDQAGPPPPSPRASVLVSAVRSDDERAVVEALGEGADPTAPDMDGVTAVHLACRLETPSILHHLLSAKPKGWRVTDNNGDTPLHIACRRKNQPMVQTLFDFGAQDLCDYMNQEHRTPLHEAAANRDILLLMFRNLPIGSRLSRDSLKEKPLHDWDNVDVAYWVYIHLSSHPTFQTDYLPTRASGIQLTFPIPSLLRLFIGAGIPHEFRMILVREAVKSCEEQSRRFPKLECALLNSRRNTSKCPCLEPWEEDIIVRSAEGYVTKYAVFDESEENILAHPGDMVNVLEWEIDESPELVKVHNTTRGSLCEVPRDCLFKSKAADACMVTCFQGPLSMEAAEWALACAIDGTFLIRESYGRFEGQQRFGRLRGSDADFFISKKYRGMTYHYPIFRGSKGYWLQCDDAEVRYFPRLTELVTYYMGLSAGHNPPTALRPMLYPAPRKWKKPKSHFQSFNHRDFIPRLIRQAHSSEYIDCDGDTANEFYEEISGGFKRITNHLTPHPPIRLDVPTIHPDVPLILQPINAISASATASMQTRQLAKAQMDRRELTLGALVGMGRFGSVNHGLWFGTHGFVEVVVKSLAPPPGTNKVDEVLCERFLSEARVLNVLHSDSIVQLVGVCMHELPYLVVMEYLPAGSLMQLLRSPASRSLSVPNLVHMAVGLAEALEYLASVGIVHRDIAVRNCLVTNDMHFKLSGFARATFWSPQVGRGSGPIPLRWCPPEALGEKDEWTTKADVWSFGILLWELCTYGTSVPYPNHPTPKASLAAILNGDTMPLPPQWPLNVRLLIKSCWRFSPDYRPTFADIVSAMMSGFPPPDPPIVESARIAYEASRAGSQLDHGDSTAPPQYEYQAGSWQAPNHVSRRPAHLRMSVAARRRSRANSRSESGGTPTLIMQPRTSSPEPPRQPWVGVCQCEGYCYHKDGYIPYEALAASEAVTERGWDSVDHVGIVTALNSICNPKNPIWWSVFSFGEDGLRPERSGHIANQFISLLRDDGCQFIYMRLPQLRPGFSPVSKCVLVHWEGPQAPPQTKLNAAVYGKVQLKLIVNDNSVPIAQEFGPVMTLQELQQDLRKANFKMP
eukprot:comp19818_c1_seq1/m.23823 comp19818_c1_seq1/g.23823  ORF comp19818_c1_seq1/g.23823 comp19818_c1_seq1/m.23823 type:complete len:1265 (-) comp19818_c1_seq1:146-3940(-)